jgi:hypothetical protein
LKTDDEVFENRWGSIQKQMVKYSPYTRRSIFGYFTVYAGGLYHGYNRRFAGELFLSEFFNIHE